MTKEEDSAKLIAAIRERVPDLQCPLCHTKEFILGEDQVPLPVGPFRGTRGIVRMGGPTLPSATLVCQHCGNTLLLNLYILGLPDLINPPPPQVIPITASIEAQSAVAANLVRVEDTPSARPGHATDEIHVTDTAAGGSPRGPHATDEVHITDTAAGPSGRAPEEAPPDDRTAN